MFSFLSSYNFLLFFGCVCVCEFDNSTNHNIYMKSRLEWLWKWLDFCFYSSKQSWLNILHFFRLFIIPLKEKRTYTFSIRRACVRHRFIGGRSNVWNGSLALVNVILLYVYVLNQFRDDFFPSILLTDIREITKQWKNFINLIYPDFTNSLSDFTLVCWRDDAKEMGAGEKWKKSLWNIVVSECERRSEWDKRIARKSLNVSNSLYK